MVHDKKKSFKCESCKGSYFHSSDLKRHVTLIHEGKKPFKCEVCEKDFKEMRSLKTHIVSIHDGIKLHKCEICNKKCDLSIKFYGKMDLENSH